MQHFLSTADWSREQLDGLLKLATELKQDPIHDRMHGKSIALLFMNPSMRTRTSFDLGMQQLGGIAIVLQPGKDAWGVEFDAGFEELLEIDAAFDGDEGAEAVGSEEFDGDGEVVEEFAFFLGEG